MARMVRPVLPLAILFAAALPVPGEAQTAFVLKSAKVNLPDSSATFPPGTGADLANANCLACHSVGMVLNQPALPRPVWEAEVNKMRNVYKAPIEETNVAALTDYLTSIKGPK